MAQKDQKKYVIGVDTGGTFTDVVVLSKMGEFTVAKAPTTPRDFSAGVMDAVEVAAKSLNMSRRSLLAQCSMFKHGTTVATNAVITSRGARVSFLTTKGFEDTTLIGRAIQKVDGLSEEEIMKMPYITKPQPLVPKSCLRGIYERIDFRGNIVIPLNIEDAKEQIRFLVEKENVDAIGVSFLFSWMNPVHEQKVKELINDMYPDRDLFLTFSHELVPVVREYGRANTVIINSFVGKIMERYLTDLNRRLREEGFAGSFVVMQSNGGTISWDRVTPVRTLASGPVGGVIGSQFVAGLLGHKNVLTTDMGGTSFDVGIIRDGNWTYEREPIVSRWRLILPMVKVESIGAGGGTIARVDPITRRLLVGPDSAGALPGPVCYDAGGAEPTVCDADLVLGFLNPEYFLGGRIRLNKEKAEEAIRLKIAEPLGLSLIEAAAGIHSIANAHMSDLIRRQVQRVGLVPEDLVMLAFGGTGPTHAAYYSAELGIKKVYVAPYSAAFSAFGIAGADMIQTMPSSFGLTMPVAPTVLNSKLQAMERDLVRDMKSEGFRAQDLEFKHNFNMRYRRQVNYLTISATSKTYESEVDVGRLVEIWKQKFEDVYGKGSAFPKAGIELVSVDMDAVGKVPKPAMKQYPAAGPDPSRALKCHREVFFPGADEKLVTTPIFEYDGLQSGNVIQGPAIVESPTTTVVIPPGRLGRLDPFLNVIIELCKP
jgi:N-methylhydantoinase A